MPAQFGRYIIQRELGRGGMATVFLAHDPEVGRDVAIKVLPPAFMQDATFFQRFQQEAKIIARLEHAAIVPLYDYGEEKGRPYFVMRLMRGGSLKERLERGPLGLPAIIPLTDRICAAMDKAHSEGIVHRDIKPANILFDDDGAAYLADFGIARLVETTQTVTALGTPQYLSPEQAHGAKVDARTDIYQMGVVLFEMFTGQVPFDAPTPAGLLHQHAYSPVPAARSIKGDLPSHCEAVLQRAMAKSPADRFQSAGELARAVARLAQPASRGRTVVAPTQFAPPTGAQPVLAKPQERPKPEAKRKRPGWLWLVGAAGLLLVMAALVVGVLAWARDSGMLDEVLGGHVEPTQEVVLLDTPLPPDTTTATALPSATLSPTEAPPVTVSTATIQPSPTPIPRTKSPPTTTPPATETPVPTATPTLEPTVTLSLTPSLTPSLTATATWTPSPTPYSRVVLFHRYPDGTLITADTVLMGDEFVDAGILVAGAPETNYCSDATSAAIDVPPHDSPCPDYSFLTSSRPTTTSGCHTVPVEIKFLNPVRLVRLTFAGASVVYELKVYDTGGSLLQTVSQEAVNCGGDFIVGYASPTANIGRVTFGHQAATTAIRQLHYER